MQTRITILTCKMIDEYLTSRTFVVLGNKKKTTKTTESSETLLDVRCLLSIAAKGAPTHFSSTLIDCNVEIIKCHKLLSEECDPQFIFWIHHGSRNQSIRDLKSEKEG